MKAKIVAETHRMAEEFRSTTDENRYDYIDESNSIVLDGCVLDVYDWIKEDQLLNFLCLVPDLTIRVLDEMKGANEIKCANESELDRSEFYTHFYNRLHRMLSYMV